MTLLDEIDRLLDTGCNMQTLDNCISGTIQPQAQPQPVKKDSSNFRLHTDSTLNNKRKSGYSMRNKLITMLPYTAWLGGFILLAYLLRTLLIEQHP